MCPTLLLTVMLRQILMAAALSGLVFTAEPSGFGSGSAEAQTCLSPADARNAVQNGQVISLSQIRGKIAQEAGGQVVSAQLCTTGSEYIYLVNVLSAAGEVKRLTVNAGNGNIVGNQRY